MPINDLLRSRKSRILLWLLLGACMIEGLFLITAPITFTTKEEAERSAAEAKRQVSEYLRLHPGAAGEMEKEIKARGLK